MINEELKNLASANALKGGNIVLSKVGGYGSTKGLLEIIKNIVQIHLYY